MQSLQLHILPINHSLVLSPSICMIETTIDVKVVNKCGKTLSTTLRED
jgi:hypothetical protein